MSSFTFTTKKGTEITIPFEDVVTTQSGNNEEGVYRVSVELIGNRKKDFLEDEAIKFEEQYHKWFGEQVIKEQGSQVPETIDMDDL